LRNSAPQRKELFTSLKVAYVAWVWHPLAVRFRSVALPFGKTDYVRLGVQGDFGEPIKGHTHIAREGAQARRV